MANSSSKARGLTLLFTCVGRRIELLQAFRAAARRLKIDLRIIAADRDPTAPGLYCCDVPLVVPRVDDPAYIAHLLDAVRTHNPAALIPTIDTDLHVLSENRAAFDSLGCKALIGEPAVITLCRDKIETYRFLREQGIDTPQTWTSDEFRTARPPLPLFLKPRSGSASRFAYRIDDADELDYRLKRVSDPIIQEFVHGTEHTLDVYVGLSGRVECVVPRARWQVRMGEVSKGVTVKDPGIMQAGRTVVEALGPSVRGLVTLQCIVTPQRQIRFIEINPRFGGGAPLSIAAGADFPAWLMQELLGRSPSIDAEGFSGGLCMLRYDWSVFVQLDDDLRPRPRSPRSEPPQFA